MTNTNMEIFNSEEFGTVRVLTLDGEPWFVGRDVAAALGYANTKDALAKHVDHEDKRIIQRSQNATFEIPVRGLTIINESGLYSLMLLSKLPGARCFKHWITSEVLPTIRKNGFYITDPLLQQFARDPDFAHAVVDGEVGDKIAEACLAQQGIRLLGWYDTGFRNIYSTMSLNSIEELQGLKIRTMQSDLHTATFEALGCLPTPMSSSEVYTSLSQGTIDAAENCDSYVMNQSLYEVCPYIINTGHFYGFCVIMMAESVFQSLTEEQQQIILDAADNSVAYQREVMAQQNTDAVDFLKEKGVEFIDLDRDALKEAVQVVYTEYADKLPADIMETIENTQG